MNLNIAILGGTSHIARALTPRLLELGGEVTLFARSPEKLASAPCRVVKGFDTFLSGRFDLVINCIGAGTPAELASDYNRWFTVLEHFDNLALDYLKKVNPQGLYIMFSSGAVYGRKSDAPSEENSCWTISPNRISVPDYYAVAKLYSEAKHRSLPQLRIADLRIFSFFSRHIDLNSGYFMTELVKALLAGQCFQTPKQELIRDYPHPADLADLILRCAKEDHINRAIDVSSRAAVSKKEILDLLSAEFGLRYEFTGSDSGSSSPNGNANIYLPTIEMAEKYLNWKAVHTSLETLHTETKAVLKHYGKA